jgi:hypothetical protein
MLSTISEQRRNRHWLRAATDVRSPLTVSCQQRRCILRNSASGRSDLFFLAGMQDERKDPPARAGGPLSDNHLFTVPG